jgi:hypothetical protein
MREAAERDRSRAEALEALYRPLREAATAELEKTKSGRKLLEEAQTMSTELGELFGRIDSGELSREEARPLASERQEQFHKRHGDQLVEVQGKHLDLRPSVEAIVQILRPESAATTWIAETSPLNAMLLQPKAAPGEVAVVTQGLDAPPPPVVQSCVTPPYEQTDYYLDGGLNAFTAWSKGPAMQGVADIHTMCWAVGWTPIDVGRASAFVGHDFPVPAGPTNYNATLHYDWNCDGSGSAFMGFAVVNVDLAIVIDKRNGTRETHAREVSLLTVPVAGADGFHHGANDVRVTIPFTRDGSSGTVRIMVGADGHCTCIAPFPFNALALFFATATVREICLTSVS